MAKLFIRFSEIPSPVRFTGKFHRHISVHQRLTGQHLPAVDGQKAFAAGARAAARRICTQPRVAKRLQEDLILIRGYF